jgi:hypothetical protein
MLEEKILNVLGEMGPRTGAALLEATDADVFTLWRTCRGSEKMHCETVGRRFLRLDKVVDGYARLSPSIMREFLTYTLVGLKEESQLIEEGAKWLYQHVKQASSEKFNIAKESISSTVLTLEKADDIINKVCFIMAGDIVYEMAHTVPRPERSTGKMVRGSDLDIVTVAADEVSREDLEALDKAIYSQKYRLLVHPNFREEIDYIIKNLSKVRIQLKFDKFEHMVACKLLHEGKFLYGSQSIFQTIKDLVRKYEIPQKLEEMEGKAIKDRRIAEDYLLGKTDGLSEKEVYKLFYTKEEAEEIF